jgi:hypothetical protein
MAVDFFDPKCVSRTNKKIFGICDDPPPSEEPAYLDHTDDTKWIAWVDNEQEKDVTFTAIDGCIDIRRHGGDKESSCDGMLVYDTTLAFVELKDRDSGRWLGKAKDQLQVTIEVFKATVGLGHYTHGYGYVVNRQRPSFHAASPVLAEKFKDDTGFVLVVADVIRIE